MAEWILRYASFKGKKVSLCLTRYYAMKMYPLLNQTLCHEGIGEWKYSATHS